MQMRDGRVIKIDHAYKITKCILIDGQRGFEAIFSVMNEFGQIVAWWLTHGSDLTEVEEHMKQFAKRYEMHGFDPIEIAFTDRCCTDRTFLRGNITKQGVIPSLRVKPRGDQVAQVIEGEGTAPQRRMKRRLSLPKEPMYPRTLTIANTIIGDFCECMRSSEVTNIIGLDTEYSDGKADTIQICTSSGVSAVFNLTILKKIPVALKTLLENPNIKKAGNQIHCERNSLKHWDVTLEGAIELSHLAYTAGIIPIRRTSLQKMTKYFYHCTLTGKRTTRLSNWRTMDLTEVQIRYAAIDAYASILVYLKLAGPSRANKQASPKISDLSIGLTVDLYTSSLGRRVATGSVLSLDATDETVGVGLKKSDIFITAALGTNKDGERISLGSIFDAADTADTHSSGVHEIRWKWKHLRPVIPHIESTPIATTDHCDDSDENDSDEENINAPDPHEYPLGDIPIVPDGIPEYDEGWGEIERNTAATVPTSPQHCSAGPPGDDVSTNDSTDQESHFPLHEYETVKQDILHIFLRYKRVLSTEHGCYREFICRLSEALFVPSAADIDFVRAALRASGMTNEEVKAQMESGAFASKRIRRFVPRPEELHNRFVEVVDQFCNVVDAKRGTKFFCKKAWNLYKVTLRHIKKDCLSDMPGVSYYIRLGEDSNGIPLYKCIRGTSALEGFHQKIQKALRGFSSSPRLAIAILHEFIYRWNHDLDITTRGLSKEYTHSYDGSAIEEEMVQLQGWDIESPPFDDWQPTFEFASTGERFGLAFEHPSIIEDVIPVDASDIDREADLAATLLTESEEIDENESQQAEGLVIPASAQWIQSKLSLSRHFGPVSTRTEIDFFDQNYLQFQCKDIGRDSDNYDFINYSAMADHIRDLITQEERGDIPKTDMTLKTAGLLKRYGKEFRRRKNESATLIGTEDSRKELRKRMRQSTASAEQGILPAQSQTSVTNKTKSLGVGSGYGTDNHELRVTTPLFQAQQNLETKSKGAEQTKMQRRPCRCRKCGNRYVDNIWLPQHPGVSLQRGHTPRPHDVCSVKKKHYAPGYPLKDGERHAK
jgi:hypothetical protein